MNHILAKYFSRINHSAFVKIDERKIFNDISRKIDNIDFVDNIELFAEYLAFYFNDRQYNMQTEYLYYPMLNSTDLAGFPSINSISSEIVEYWKRRMDEVNHPIIKARYSGLVLEFSSICFNIQVGNDVVDKHINSLLGIIKNNLYRSPNHVENVFRRALYLSIHYNRIDFLNNTILSIIQYDQENSENLSPDVCLTAFKLLIQNQSIQKILGEYPKNVIIERLFVRLRVFSIIPATTLKADYIYTIATELIRFYYVNKDINNVKNIINTVQSCYFKDFDILSLSTKRDLVLRLIKLYERNNLIEEKNFLVEKLVCIEKSSDQYRNNYFSTEFHLSKFAYLCDIIFQSSFEDIVANIVLNLIISKQQITKLYNEYVKDYYLFPYEHNFNNENDSSSISEVIRFIPFYLEYLQSNILPYLNKIISFGIVSQNISIDILKDIIEVSPFLDKESRKKAIDSISNYFIGNHFGFINSIMPILEMLFRKIVPRDAEIILHAEQITLSSDFSLEALISSNYAGELFGEDLQLFLNSILTYSNGLNLTNNIYNGYYSNKLVNSNISDLLFFVFCILVNNKSNPHHSLKPYLLNYLNSIT